MNSRCCRSSHPCARSWPPGLLHSTLNSKASPMRSSPSVTSETRRPSPDFLQGEDEETTAATDAELPVAFDWRDHMGPSEGMKVIEQGECSSCYATAAASVMSDRFYIGSK